MYPPSFLGPHDRNHITEAKIKGKIVVYDRCSQNRHAYDETNFKFETEFEYIGEGVIWSVDGVRQSSATVYHFWVRQ
jgi:hypothetical protein